MDNSRDHSSYPERLLTFEGHWTGHESTAYQLAAIGHVSDRPPLEALEEGSRCVKCGLFLPKEASISAFEGAISGSGVYRSHGQSFDFHHPKCLWLQVRIPLDSTSMSGTYGFSIRDARRKFEVTERTSARDEEGRPQTSSLFSLPTELRLHIYSMLLPSLDPVTEIVTLNNYSARVITRAGSERTGKRNSTKANLLRTCKIIHEEALDMLFTSTSYQFESTKVLYLFLRHIGQHGRGLLRSIDVSCGWREDAIAFALLASCDKLRHITIRLPRPRIRFPWQSVWSEEGIMCLLALSGLEQVHFGACKAPNCMDETKHDAGVIRRELTRPKGTPGALRIVDGHLDV